MKRLFQLILFIGLLNIGIQAQEIAGERINLAPVIQITNAEIMQHWANFYPPGFIKKRNFDLGLEEPNRENLPSSEGIMDSPQWPPLPEDYQSPAFSPQTPGISFTGASNFDTGPSFPPDVMGAVGPTQYLIFVNGRLKTFNKTTGTVDGIIDASPDVFFSLITTPPQEVDKSHTRQILM